MLFTACSTLSVAPSVCILGANFYDIYCSSSHCIQCVRMYFMYFKNFVTCDPDHAQWVDWFYLIERDGSLTYIEPGAVRSVLPEIEQKQFQNSILESKKPIFEHFQHIFTTRFYKIIVLNCCIIHLWWFSIRKLSKLIWFWAKINGISSVLECTINTFVRTVNLLEGGS